MPADVFPSIDLTVGVVPATLEPLGPRFVV